MRRPGSRRKSFCASADEVGGPMGGSWAIEAANRSVKYMNAVPASVPRVALRFTRGFITATLKGSRPLRNPVRGGPSKAPGGVRGTRGARAGWSHHLRQRRQRPLDQALSRVAGEPAVAGRPRLVAAGRECLRRRDVTEV